MTTVTTNSQVHLSSLVSLRLVNIVENAASAISEQYFAWRTFKYLSNLSDHQLNDIGLARGDIKRTSGK